jgi:non-ribosomal peptide synthetase component F
MAAESTAQKVAQRVDALAAALRAAGVPPERSAGLLAAAATAAMNAVMLDAVLDELHDGTPVPVTEVGAGAQPIQLAA